MRIENIITQTQEDLFIHLYEKAFPKVAAFIHKMGGSLDEAKDIFQDALIIYYEKKQETEFRLQVDEQAYLIGTAKHLWYKTHNKKQLNQELDSATDLSLTEELQPQVSASLLLFVERSGKKCMELLTAFYYDKLNMKEIAARFSFSGERSATAQKYKCLEKVRNSIQHQALNQEDFYE